MAYTVPEITTVNMLDGCGCEADTRIYCVGWLMDSRAHTLVRSQYCLCYNIAFSAWHVQGAESVPQLSTMRP